MVAWSVEVTDEFSRWARELRKVDRDSSRQVGAAVELLKQHGPSLKRPLVGEITTSKLKNMKELRPGSSGRSEIRILFVSIPGSRLSYWWRATRPVTGSAGTAKRCLGPRSCMRSTLRR